MSLQSDTQLEPEELRSLNHQPSTNPLLAKADRAVRTLRSRNVQLANSPVLSTSYTADPPSPPEGDHQEHTISLIPTSVANNPNYTEREYHQGVGMQPPATTRNNAAHSSRRFEYLCQRSGKKSRRHRRKEGSRVTFPHPLLNKGATEMTQSSMGKDRGNAQEAVDVMEQAITEEEVKRTVKRMPYQSAPGPDKITYATWRRMDRDARMLSQIMETCRINRKIPPSWKRSTTILIPKKGDARVIRNWRLINLQNTMYKIYASLIAQKLMEWARDVEVISPSQKGFMSCEGCLEHNFVLSSILLDSQEMEKPGVHHMAGSPPLALATPLPGALPAPKDTPQQSAPPNRLPSEAPGPDHYNQGQETLGHATGTPPTVSADAPSPSTQASMPTNQKEGTPSPPPAPISKETAQRLEKLDRALSLLRPNPAIQWEPEPQERQPPAPDGRGLWQDVTPTNLHVLEAPITSQEVPDTIKRTNTNSAPGPDRLPYATWKRLDPDHNIVTSILNTCRINAKIPPSWKGSTTVLSHKGDNVNHLDNWRPIALLNTLASITA
ncbi:hypothetical protein EMCRGX_G005426 [Ephydatia muelleri]